MYEAVVDKIGKPVVFNICVLGALITLTGLVEAQSIMRVLQTKIPVDLLEVNEKALQIGLQL
jgi:2-oxoglutarate ferredoxin oxidoreductase subunit gamma